MQQQMNFLAPASGKTSPVPSQATAEETSKQSFRRSVPSVSREYMFLDLRIGAGNLLGAYWETATALPGGSTMLNTGESPSDVKDVTLSSVLQANAPEKYSLSQKACLGILRRAEKRGKELPNMLKEALMEVARQNGSSSDDEDNADEDDFTEEDLEESEEEEDFEE